LGRSPRGGCPSSTRSSLGADRDPAGRLAGGVSAARQERSEAAAPQDHLLAALRQSSFGISRASVWASLPAPPSARRSPPAVPGDLLRVLGSPVSGAGEELAEAPPLLDHPLAALLADEIGGKSPRASRRACARAPSSRSFVNFPWNSRRASTQGIFPSSISSSSSSIRAVYCTCRMSLKCSTRRSVTSSPERRRVEPALLLVDVVAALDDREDGRVGGGTADAVLLELLDQSGLGEARRGLREVLVRSHLLAVEGVTLAEGRQLAG